MDMTADQRTWTTIAAMPGIFLHCAMVNFGDDKIYIVAKYASMSQ